MMRRDLYEYNQKRIEEYRAWIFFDAGILIPFTGFLMGKNFASNGWLIILSYPLIMIINGEILDFLISEIEETICLASRIFLFYLIPWLAVGAGIYLERGILPEKNVHFFIILLSFLNGILLLIFGKLYSFSFEEDDCIKEV